METDEERSDQAVLYYPDCDLRRVMRFILKNVMQLTFGSGEVSPGDYRCYGSRVQSCNARAKIMGLQEISVDLSAELKRNLRSKYFALAVLKAKVKVSGKFKVR